MTGKFCSNCGEKAHKDHDKKIVHLLDESFHFITHFEGSFFTSFKTFLKKPGKYSADYCGGIRKKYFKPISFFLMLVILYLLFPRFQGLNMKFYAYTSPKYNKSWYAVPAAEKKMKTHHLTEQELAEKYDKKSPAFAKFFLLILLPLVALVLAILFYTSKKYFFDHFILSTELTSFYIFSQFLFLPFLSLIVDFIVPSLNYIFSDGSWVWTLFYLIFALFVGVAFQRFYRQKKWLTILKTIVFFFVFFIIKGDLYNLLLYHLVMLFI